jgi:hypothetical protein
MSHILVLTIVLYTQQIFAFEASNQIANKTNPNIGVNVMLLGQSASGASEYDNGFDIQEIELQISSPIDPYWSGSALLAIHSEEDPTTLESEYVIEPEEVYFENLSLPGLAFRIGKQKLYFGKLNNAHAHAQPFVDAPLTVLSILGEEGLSETGVSASYLMPTSWYFEIIGQAFTAENENVFGSTQKGDLGEAIYIKNLFDLTESKTLEWIVSAATGKNNADETQMLMNTAVTYKWRPKTDGANKSFSATAEYSQSDVDSKLDSTPTLQTNLDTQSATSIWLIYQLRKNWFVQARGEFAKFYLEDEYAETVDLNKYSALVSYAPTEFSSVRLQYDSADYSNRNEIEHRVALQFNFSMGAHPAHSY